MLDEIDKLGIIYMRMFVCYARNLTTVEDIL